MNETTRIRVADTAFDCENCATTIERVLRKEGGVEGVIVDDAERELEVQFDQSRIDEDRIAGIIEEWGYTPEDSLP